MLQLNRETIIRALKYIAITAAVIMLVVFTFYWINTGRIFIHAPQGVGVKSFSYCAAICENLTTAERTDSVMAPRGDYVVRVLLDNNTDYVSNVTVSGLFATTTINPKSYRYDFSASTSKNSQFILPLGQGLLVYNADEIATTANSAFQPAQRPLAAAMRVNDDQTLLLYGTTSQGEASSADALAVIYDQKSNTTRTLGAISDATSSSTVYRGNDALYVLNRDAGRITKVSASGVSTIVLPNSIKPASNATLPIVALNGEMLAVLSGNDFAYDEDASQPTSASIVTLYSLKDFSKLKEINIGKRNDILGLSLSPDNSFVVAIGNSSLTSYEIKSGKNGLSVPAVSIDANTPTWKDNTSFIYQEGVGGVYMADLLAREAYSIIDNSILQINHITGAINDKVYLTGSAASSSPVGEIDSRAESSSYVIALNSSSNQAPDSSESSITRSLPHSSSNYSVGYHFNNQKPVLDIDTDEHSRNLAIRAVYKLGFDPADYSFNFLQYTNPFKEGR
jgi:hypothetical protein